MNLATILKNRRKELNMTLLDIAEKMGVSEATVQRWESGNIKNLRHERIAELACVLGISPAELMGWESPKDTFNIFDLPSIMPMPEMRKIPLLGKISCGVPTLAVENIDEYVDIPKNIHADFALQCKGDSMINAHIFDNDIVYIKLQSDVDNGEIAAVLIDDETTLKRVYKYKDKVILQAENPVYAPMSYSGYELEKIRILGKAIAFTSIVK